MGLAVPRMVIDELKQQKERSYRRDLQKIKEIYRRLEGLPNVGEEVLKLPDETYSVGDFIERQATAFIAATRVNILDFDDDDAVSMLKSMLAKVVGQEPIKSPFAKSGNYKDAGFKDNVIWETIMHFKKVTDFDKVIFFTKDGDYKENCISDFKEKWERHIEILKDELSVVAAVEKDYLNYIENRKVYEYAHKDYFLDYIDDLLGRASQVDYEGESITIENYRVTNICKSVIQVSDDEGDFISIEILTEILVFTTFKGDKIEVPVVAKTTLSDLDYMEIEQTTFEPEIS